MLLRMCSLGAALVVLAGCQSEWAPTEGTLETYPVVTEVEPETAPDSPDGLERLLPARYRTQNESQCVTVLKEIAFCSEEDVFLRTLGATEALNDDAAREAFLGQVERWFEPGAAREDCLHIVQATRFPGAEARKLWRAASEGSGRVCAEFGQALVEAEFFEQVGDAIWGAR